RFNKFINFKDYNALELYEIFMGMCKKSGYIPNNDAKNYIKEHFARLYINKGENFANGREVRNYFEAVVVNQANRLVLDKELTNDELAELKIEDVKLSN
ncbi:MAG: hypothetical protein ACI4VF_04335, partial [Lachnospirales bacterium]